MTFQGDPPRRVSGLNALGGGKLTVVEVQAAFLAQLSKRLGWEFTDDDWTDEERAEMARLVEEKYGDDEGWNLRR